MALLSSYRQLCALQASDRPKHPFKKWTLLKTLGTHSVVVLFGPSRSARFMKYVLSIRRDARGENCSMMLKSVLQIDPKKLPTNKTLRANGVRNHGTRSHRYFPKCMLVPSNHLFVSICDKKCIHVIKCLPSQFRKQPAYEFLNTSQSKKILEDVWNPSKPSKPCG